MTDEVPVTGTLSNRAALVAFFTFSFWSSGVFLIQLLNTYHAWDSPFMIAGLFIASIPLVAFCVISIRKSFAEETQAQRIITDTLASVLLMHGFSVAFFSSLYSLASTPSLSATAWLLWFGGVAVALSKRTQKI